MLQLSASWGNRPIPAGTLPTYEAPRAAPPAALCEEVTDLRGSWWPGRAILDEKHDGIRALWIGGKWVSRNGVPIEAAAHLADAARFAEEALGGSHVIDGEFLEPGGFNETLQAFNSGWCSGAGRIVAFDAIPLDVWKGKAAGEALIERRTRLLDAAAGLRGLEPAHWSAVASRAHAQEMAGKIWTRGGEGVVVKDAASLHRAGRSGAWRRIKRHLTADCPLLAVAPQKGAEDMAGAMIVQHGTRRVRVSVRRWSDKDRRILMATADQRKGEIVEVRHDGETLRGSLRAPTFGRWRSDKRKLEN